MNFFLYKCEIDEFAILQNSLPENLDDVFVKNNIIVANISQSEKQIVLKNTIQYEYKDSCLLKVSATFYFQIESLSWDKLIFENKIIFKTTDLYYFGNIIIGAMRGILIVKTINSLYSNLILPPINLENLFNEDLVVEN